jgi:hypothetical protein
MSTLRRLRWIPAAFLLHGLALLGPPASAAPPDRGSISFVFENDVFVGTDRNYTNGLLLSYLSGAQSEETLPSRVARALSIGAPPDVTRFGVSLGHSLFTPEDISVATPLPDQHPYAGWLYLGASLVAERGRHLDALSLQVGIVGPAAQGEWAQKKVHELVDTTEPRGWNNQLKNEPGVVVTWDRVWRLDAPFRAGRIGADVLPSVSLSAGNVLTQAAVGAMFRLGTGLEGDFGPVRIGPSLAGAGPRTLRDRFGGYFFVGGAGRAVAQNIFLDGNTTRRSQSVDRRVLVAEGQGGLVLFYGRYQLAFSAVVRSREFETQRTTQAFGALSIGARL